MKSVLISIQPKWCELIASGKKTVEVRKTKPKLETPFKVYIYCTKQGKQFFHGGIGEKECLFKNPDTEKIKFDYSFELMCCKNEYTKDNFLSGKVIGEFVCDKVENIFSQSRFWLNEDTLKSACLSKEQIWNYANGAEKIYAWHISDLVIYDKPRELSEFYVEGDCDCMNCKKCAWFDKGNGNNVEDDCNLAYKGVELHKSFKPIKRPPQSWCYVESEGEG